MLKVSQITQITQISLAVGEPCRTTRLSDVTFDTIAQVVCIEVYKYADMFIKKFQIGEQLFSKHRSHVFNGLELNNYSVIDHQVETERSFKLVAFIKDGYFHLANHFQTTLLKLKSQGFLINRLKQPRAKLVVNIKYSASYFVSNIVVSHSKLFIMVTNKAEEYCVRKKVTQITQIT